MSPPSDPLLSAALLTALVAAILALRLLLRRFIGWLGIVWERGPHLVLSGARAVRADRAGSWFAKRFPRHAGYLRARADPRLFTGLPLTLIAAAALYCAFLFGGLIEDVLESEEIRVVDATIDGWVAPLRTPALVAFFAWITELGSMPTLTAVAIVTTAFLLAHGPTRYVAPVWLTVAGSQVTSYLGKFILARPRPEFILDVTAGTPSFPSGHTTAALAVYGIIAYAVLRDVGSARMRFDVAYGTGVLIALVAFSRILLGVHFPSDVAGGILVGLFWLLAGITLAEIRRPA